MKIFTLYKFLNFLKLYRLINLNYDRMLNVALLDKRSSIMNKNTWIIGFTLFAMFFGAGNLIFPTNLGLDSGHFLWPAILAFALTGIGLPLLGVVVGALDHQGYIGIKENFTKIFFNILIIIYLTIGPLFAIPRTASTSFEMTITPIAHTNGSLALLILLSSIFNRSLFMSQSK